MTYYQVNFDRGRGVYYVLKADGEPGLTLEQAQQLNWQVENQYSDLGIILDTLKHDFWFTYINTQ